MVDLGSHTTKAGFCGDDAPKVLFPSVCSAESSVASVHLFPRTHTHHYPLALQYSEIFQNFSSLRQLSRLTYYLQDIGVIRKDATAHHFHLGTNELCYRRDFMEIKQPFVDGRGVCKISLSLRIEWHL